jgi:hypothetical protein
MNRLLRLTPIAVLLAAATSASFAQSTDLNSSARKERINSAYDSYRSGGTNTATNTSTRSGMQGGQASTSNRSILTPEKDDTRVTAGAKRAGTAVKEGAQTAGGVVKRGAQRTGNAVSNAAAKADSAIRSKVGDGPANSPNRQTNNPSPG